MDYTTKRNIQRIRSLSIFALLLYPINTFYFFISGETLYDYKTSNIVSIIFLLFALLGLLFNQNNNISDCELEKINRKTRPLYGLTGLIAVYILIDYLFHKNTNILISFILMETHLIAVISFTRLEMTFNLKDRQLEWIKATQNRNISQESNFTWRLKIWFTPLENTYFKDRIPSPSNLFLILILAYILYNSGVDKRFPITLIILILVSFRYIMTWIECLFSLQTSLTGICTGYIFNEESKGQHSYYSVYVTDYENKREIHFRSYESLNLTDGQEVKVIHGIFSKLVISVNGITLDQKTFL